MSWFKRRPRVKEPPKTKGHRSSPTAEKMLEENKKSVRAKSETKEKKH
jgi:hypothetical protein